MVQILLNSKEIEIDAKNKLGHNVLHIAAMNKQEEMCQLLLKFVDQNKERDNRGMLPIHYAALKGYDKIVDQLINHEDQRGVAEAVSNLVNARQIDDLTPVLYACHSGSLDLLQLLVKHGGDVKATSKKGVTALHLASAAGHLDIVKHLIDICELDPTVTSFASGSQPIHIATSGGHLEIVQYFI